MDKCLSDPTALVSRAVASKLNPLIGSLNNGHLDTLNDCSRLIRDLGYAVSISSSTCSDIDIATSLYLITGAVAAALDYETEVLTRMRVPVPSADKRGGPRTAELDKDAA